MVRSIAVSLLVIITAGCDQTSTEATSVVLQPRGLNLSSYAPSSCKTSAGGMVYFSLGHEVFRRPYEERVGIVSLSTTEGALEPARPDPREQAGCPLNPVAAKSFNIAYPYRPAHAENYPANTSFEVRQATLIGLTTEAKKSRLEAVRFGNQVAYERDFARVQKQNKRACEVLANGLTSCMEPNSERPRTAWSIKFQADLAHYAAPSGHPYTVSCTTWLYMEKQDCSAEYVYTDDTRIAYKFELHELPPLEFIEYDKGLRAKVEGMRVANFKWPKVTP